MQDRSPPTRQNLLATHGRTIHLGQKATCALANFASALPLIVLQKPKVAGLRIFRENKKREAIADSYNLNRVTEVAREFNVRR